MYLNVFAHSLSFCKKEGITYIRSMNYQHIKPIQNNLTPMKWQKGFIKAISNDIMLFTVFISPIHQTKSITLHYNVGI